MSKPLSTEFLQVADLLLQATSTIPALPFLTVNDAIKYRAVFNRDRVKFRVLFPSKPELDNFEVIIRRGDGLTEAATRPSRGRQSGPGFANLIDEARRAISLADLSDFDSHLNVPLNSEGLPDKTQLWYVIFLYKLYSPGISQHAKLAAAIRAADASATNVKIDEQLDKLAQEGLDKLLNSQATPNEQAEQALKDTGFIKSNNSPKVN